MYSNVALKPLFISSKMIAHEKHSIQEDWGLMSASEMTNKRKLAVIICSNISLPLEQRFEINVVKVYLASIMTFFFFNVQN